MKLIIFDLDGVLVDAKKIHFEALNESLDLKYKISWDEHLSKYDGLKTNQKLVMLTKEKNLPVEMYESVWKKKQVLTLEKLKKIENSTQLINCLSLLVEKGYKIACCSNSIRETINVALDRLGIINYFDLILSNEDVSNSKPHPEIYWKAISIFGVLPEETLIIEDSPYGLLAANRSSSHVMRVNSPKDVNYENIKMYLNSDKKNMKPKWKNEKLNVLIPMAGAGSRFEQAGYTFPKPLIEVKNKPMIQLVIENLNIDANYIYVVQKKHREKYNLDTLLNLITPGCKIIETNGLTEGAACTALLTKEYINNENPLFFANSDQFVEWDSNEFMYKMQETNVDGGIVTFNSIHPKWSFVKLDDNGFVKEVAEKTPISDIATVGFYFWKKGSDFVKYAEQMIEKNIRVNGEFYVCPVFNEAINGGIKVTTFDIKKMWGLGTPEDLKYFLENYK
jgi:beta-phosphoglucomutase-like phosphatase (HAD superfamily)/dTDP-glucose pyrophosphorylase